MTPAPEKRILIVDDDLATRKVIRSILEKAKSGPFKIYEAADGIQCLMAVERHSPIDLLLLDVEMPHMDGLEVCRAIRRVNKDVPIVIVTAHSEIENRVAGREAGADSFIPKPVRQDHLQSVVGLLTSTPRRSRRMVQRAPVPSFES